MRETQRRLLPERVMGWCGPQGVGWGRGGGGGVGVDVGENVGHGVVMFILRCKGVEEGDEDVVQDASGAAGARRHALQRLGGVELGEREGRED